jgi:ABC-type polysaccharide/polyol phosphate export permease
MVALYASPVIYPLAAAGSLRPVLMVNPMTGPLQLARFAIFGSADSLAAALLVTAVWVLGLTVVTVLAFRRHERIAMDRL